MSIGPSYYEQAEAEIALMRQQRDDLAAKLAEAEAMLVANVARIDADLKEKADLRAKLEAAERKMGEWVHACENNLRLYERERREAAALRAENAQDLKAEQRKADDLRTQLGNAVESAEVRGRALQTAETRESRLRGLLEKVLRDALPTCTRPGCGCLTCLIRAALSPGGDLPDEVRAVFRDRSIPLSGERELGQRLVNSACRACLASAYWHPKEQACPVQATAPAAEAHVGFVDNMTVPDPPGLLDTPAPIPAAGAVVDCETCGMRVQLGPDGKCPLERPAVEDDNNPFISVGYTKPADEKE